MLDALRYWLDLGLDGFRLDAVPYLYEEDGTNCENLPKTHEFLKKVRRTVDDEYPDKVLLAEANQWPEDVVEYFGDGDECHMAFHFPVMPRMFMALRREEATPIYEILERTPEIPGICQWGLFLRNHDELTLEMVTDEERDYMYAEYAKDPRMKINVGIRRRLAPLLEGGRGDIELLHAIMFSLPGSPVLYYGDEIAMGDNVYLGDRDGVRTPMQWTSDRNGGFSRADFAQLYAPPLMDPVYGFQAVNVEAQLRTADVAAALVQALRRAAQGAPRLRPGHLRARWSRRTPRSSPTSVASRRTSSSACTTWRAPPRRSSWTSASTRAAGPRRCSAARASRASASCRTCSRWPRAAGSGSCSRRTTNRRSCCPMPRIDMTTLDEETLAEWLLGRRWFGSKARDVAHVRVMDLLTLHDGPPQLVAALVEARFPGGTHAVYQLLLSLREGVAGQDAIGSLEGTAVMDGLADPQACEVLGGLLRERAVVGDEHAKVTFHWLDGVEPPRAGAAVRGMGAEQSNSSVVFDDALVLKAFRRVEAGDNPELEMLRFLSERGFANVAPLGGWYQYEGDLMDATFGVVQRFVPNARDGWELALDELGDDPERFVGAPARARRGHRPDAHRARLGPDRPGLRARGALRRDAGAADGHRRRGDRAAVHRPAARARGRADRRPRRGGARPPAACSRASARAASSSATTATCISGQTLLAGDGDATEWIILDFEGEPARSLLERRRKRSGLRDVAGMLRSFAYVASASDIQRGRPAPEGWEDRAREAFLAGYLDTVDSSLLPPGEANTRRLLSVYELEKAVYELRYELNNRPDWVRIPVAGIARLLEEPIA